MQQYVELVMGDGQKIELVYRANYVARADRLRAARRYFFKHNSGIIVAVNPAYGANCDLCTHKIINNEHWITWV